MIDFLGKAFRAITSKLGAVGPIIIKLAESLSFHVKNEDVARALEICDALDARFAELREVCDAGEEVTADVRARLADNEASGADIASVGLKVQRLIDEVEDVITGEDEDD